MTIEFYDSDKVPLSKLCILNKISLYVLQGVSLLHFSEKTSKVDILD